MEKIGYFNVAKSNIKSGLNKLEDLCIELNFGDRDVVEAMDGVVQPICAGCILTASGKILVVNKSAKSTGEISPEKDKSLLYVGGHLDKEDFIDQSFHDTFLQGMQREIFEELGIKVNTKFKPLVVYTPITEKSQKHVGIIFPIILEKEFEPKFTDGKTKFIEFSQLSEIRNFESWSNIIARELIQNKICEEKER